MAESQGFEFPLFLKSPTHSYNFSFLFAGIRKVL